MTKDIDNYVREHFKEKIAPIQQLINCANFDLYFGPYPANEPIDSEFIYPGFPDAIHQINSAIDDIGEVWVDYQCGYVTDKEPKGEEINGEWIEPCWEDWYHYERKDVLRVLIGKELHKYL